MGLYASGDCTSPASSAACGSVSLDAGGGEEPLGRGLDPVRPGAEVGDVQVVLQDLVLGHGVLELGRVAHLLQLAGERVLGRGLALGGADVLVVLQHVADVLHGQRGGTLVNRTVADVGRRGPQHALGVDGAVLVEPAVLGGDHRLPHDLGDLLELHRLAVLE
jgi:hypothetical protein